MNILDVSIIVFVLMEMSNVIILYFAPEFKYGNGVAVFDGFVESKEDENLHLFVRYMTNWVAGVKLIFIVLLLVVMIFGNEATKIGSVCAMILSIASFYFGLHPIIKKLDERNKITPKGYSKTLLWMINGFMLMFTIALVFYLVTMN